MAAVKRFNQEGKWNNSISQFGLVFVFTWVINRVTSCSTGRLD